MPKRDDNPENFPVWEIRNNTGSPLVFTLAGSLEFPSGVLRGQVTSASRTLAPGATIILPSFPDSTPASLHGDIALLRATVIPAGGEPVTGSAIVGTPRPRPRGQDALVGMNAHLHRYTPGEQWRMLRMMRDAGVTTIRMEHRFQAPDAQDRFRFDPKLDEVLLGAEAFGMTPLLALTWFPESFYDAPDKAGMAWSWAKAVGERYKGRVFDYQYGNETNSGWAAFGAAADMTVHNQAMALGTLAANPDATPATLGIAEALPNYLRELFRTGLAPYVRAVTLHPYCGTPEAGIAKTLACRRIVGEYGHGQKIWLTETGFQVSEPGILNPVTQQLTLVNGFTLDQQADLTARLFLLGRSHSIDRIYYYDFFGKNDPETFWLVDGDFNPRPAYHAVKYTSALLKEAAPLGGTDPVEPVQKHLFRRPDGAVVLAAWAVRDDVGADLHLPPPAANRDLQATTILGEPVALPSTGTIRLGPRPVLIKNLPDIPSFVRLDVLANPVDGRNWNAPMQRWTANPGDTLNIPCVVFNPGAGAITAHPVLLNRYPGWAIKLPPPFAVPPGRTVARQITLTLPDNLVPGVEYRPRFAIETTGPRRTTPFEPRIWINGKFPYDPHLADTGITPAWPVRRIIDEKQTGFGRDTILARQAPAAAARLAVDGNLADWNPDDFVTLDQVGQWKLRDAGRPMREDWFARAALRWDSTRLYFACIVLDNDLSLPDLTSRDWRDSDNIRLFLSTAPADKRAARITKDDYLVFMTPTREFHDEPPAVMLASLGGFLHKNLEPRIKIASRIWHGGYLVEASIPFAMLGISPRPGLELGCNIMSDDSDDGYRRFSGMTTFRSLNYWNSPQSLGTLRLVP
jgi:hypothetical protein